MWLTENPSQSMWPAVLCRFPTPDVVTLFMQNQLKGGNSWNGIHSDKICMIFLSEERTRFHLQLQITLSFVLPSLYC